MKYTELKAAIRERQPDSDHFADLAEWRKAIKKAQTEFLLEQPWDERTAYAVIEAMEGRKGFDYSIYHDDKNDLFAELVGVISES